MDGSDQENCALPKSIKARAERIANLNDQLRSFGANGRIAITSNAMAAFQDRLGALLSAVTTFDTFDADNDPQGERDFGGFDFNGQRVLWKIDYYDPAGEFGSEDPADPAKTLRVLTIMLASDY